MLQLSFLTKGEGEDLVFFHGYGANKECFLRQITYFSRFYRVTAFDFPGFGASEALPYAYSVGDYAKETAEWLSRQNVVRPRVVAHSFGARVAVKMAGESDCFQKMLLTGAAGIIDNRNAAYHLKVFRYRLVKRFAFRYAEAHFGSEEYKKLSPLMRESYKKIVNEDLRRDAARIQSEVLLLHGEKDETTPLSQAKIYQKYIPNATLVTMKDCGHFAFLDDPVSFNFIAEEFFN